MIDPAAVSDEMGEWIELYNGDNIPINLDGWVLADQGDDYVVLNGELWLLPGAYAILARMTDAAQNGNVMAQMGYTGMQLANQFDVRRANEIENPLL